MYPYIEYQGKLEELFILGEDLKYDTGKVERTRCHYPELMADSVVFIFQGF